MQWRRKRESRPGKRSECQFGVCVSSERRESKREIAEEEEGGGVQVAPEAGLIGPGAFQKSRLWTLSYPVILLLSLFLVF
jgi:hypothetical protein